MRITSMATAVVLAVAVVASPAHAQEGTVLYAGSADSVPGSYIVVLDESKVGVLAVADKASALARRYGGAVDHVYSVALRGFSARLGAQAAKRLAADPAVAYVEANRYVSKVGTQTNPPSWGLNRIDQRNLPMDSSYTYPNLAANVRAYIIDTGIRFTHTDFGGRAVTGFDAIDGGSADDCDGHGTHVAGTVGGTAHGVAKGITLVGVRVLNCVGTGTIQQVITGVEWVTADHDPGELAVANMSLSSSADVALDTAVRNSIADGVFYSVAAGNNYGGNACNRSPARVAEAVTVGSTGNTTTSVDVRSDFSNVGTCLDLFAPGWAIVSANHAHNTATAVLSGTSMAAPHVAGAAALIRSANPSWTPQQVRDEIVNDATSGVVGSPGTGSPNKLLYVDNTSPPPPPPPPPLSVYIDGPGAVQVKQVYTYTAVTSGFSGPTFTWSERFCDDYAGTVCSAWATITGLGNTFNRLLNKDCGTQERNFQVRVVVLNGDGREAGAQMTTSLCELALH